MGLGVSPLSPHEELVRRAEDDLGREAAGTGHGHLPRERPHLISVAAAREPFDTPGIATYPELATRELRGRSVAPR
jgi:hypothetical protein